MVVFRAWGEEVMRSYSVSTVFQGNKMKNIPEMDDGTSYTINVNVLMPQKCTLKNGENGKFCYVCNNFKKQKDKITFYR